MRIAPGLTHVKAVAGRGGHAGTHEDRHRSPTPSARRAAAGWPLAGVAGACTASADVLHRRRQRVAGDALVGAVAGGHALGAVDDARDADLRRLAACVPDAVPGAAQLHLRLPADRVPALDGHGRPEALALRAGGPGPDGRAAGHPAGRSGLASGADRRPVDGAGRLDHGIADAGPVARGRHRQDLARALLLRRVAAGLAGAGDVHRLRAGRVAHVGVRQHQARWLRPAATGVRDGGAPHVPVLRRQRGARCRGWARCGRC